MFLVPPGSKQTATVGFTGPRPLCLGIGWTQSVLGGSGPKCLPTSSHLGQSGGEVAGPPMQQNNSGGPGGMSSRIPLCLPNLPNLLTQLFDQILNRNLSNLNLHVWLLEPQLSRTIDGYRSAIADKMGNSPLMSAKMTISYLFWTDQRVAGASPLGTFPWCCNM